MEFLQPWSPGGLFGRDGRPPSLLSVLVCSQTHLTKNHQTPATPATGSGLNVVVNGLDGQQSGWENGPVVPIEPQVGYVGSRESGKGRGFNAVVEVRIHAGVSSLGLRPGPGPGPSPSPVPVQVPVPVLVPGPVCGPSRRPPG